MVAQISCKDFIVGAGVELGGVSVPWPETAARHPRNIIVAVVVVFIDAPKRKPSG